MAKDGSSLGRSPKQFALTWSIFTMSYAAIVLFFNDVLLDDKSQARHLALYPDKLCARAGKRELSFSCATEDYGLVASAWSRVIARVGSSSAEPRSYLADMKNLRDILSHADDPRAVSNDSGALWPLSDCKHSVCLMGAEGFIQVCCALITHTGLAYGGSVDDFPDGLNPNVLVCQQNNVAT